MYADDTPAGVLQPQVSAWASCDGRVSLPRSNVRTIGFSRDRSIRTDDIRIVEPMCDETSGFDRTCPPILVGSPSRNRRTTWRLAHLPRLLSPRARLRTA